MGPFRDVCFKSSNWSDGAMISTSRIPVLEYTTTGSGGGKHGLIDAGVTVNGDQKVARTRSENSHRLSLAWLYAGLPMY